jgi:formate C-acetyltransferase
MFNFTPVTDRVTRLRDRYRNTPISISAERAKIVTEVYKENRYDPNIIKRAKVMYALCSRMTILVQPDELLVGNISPYYKGVDLAPEYDELRWLVSELRDGSFGKRNRTDEEGMNIAPEDIPVFIDLYENYWKDNNITHYVDAAMPEGMKTVAKSGAIPFFEKGNGGCPVGHFNAAYYKVIDKGFGEIKREAVAKLAALEGKLFGDSVKKYTFYKAIVIICEAGILLSKRYAEKCRETAKSASPERAAELLKMADSLDWIMENPCRSFAEAVQATLLYHQMLVLDGLLHGLTLGRFDQYTGKYYEKDLTEGKITPAEGQEYVDCFFLKLADMMKGRSKYGALFNGSYSAGQHMSLGGLTRDGRDATNPVSYFMLQSSARLSLHEPPLSLRVHKNTPPELWEAAIETAKKVGGVPTMQNDEVIIPALMNSGLSLEDARDYCIIGCMEPAGSGCEWPACGGTGAATMVNLLKMLMIAINNGVMPGTDERCAPETGYLYEMNSIDEVMEAYRKTVDYFIDWHVTGTNVFEYVASELMPLPVASATIEGCMEHGADVMWGGAKYNSTGSAGVGCANVADSLSAIQYMCFDKKLCTTRELYDAFMNNWQDEGQEILRQTIRNKVPRYGNDEAYVDELARVAMDVFSDKLNAAKGPRGGYRAGLYPVTAHVVMGMMTPASPDGRKAGDPLADGISPMQGMDTHGPSAILNSVARINHVNNGNGTQLNMRFHPNTVKGEEGERKLAELISTFFEKGGMHIQYNVIDTDTLRKAQQQPDDYRDLVIRVAGYSAYFVELGKALQEDVISRTEQNM